MFIIRLLVLLFLVAYSYSTGQVPSDSLNAFGRSAAATFFVWAPLLYLLPTYEAWKRKQPNLVSIFALNLLLGWTLIGWVVSLVWALKAIDPEAAARGSVDPWAPREPTHAPPPAAQPALRASMADELRKLSELKTDGVLTSAEFDEAKAKILAGERP